MTIKAIAFDVGNVLVSWDLELLARHPDYPWWSAFYWASSRTA